MEKLTASQKILLKAFKELVETYNAKKQRVNYVDIRNLENYIIEQGVTRDVIVEFVEN